MLHIFPGYYSPNPSKWWYRWAYARKTWLTHWSTSFLHQVIHIRSVICGLPPLPTPHPHPTPHPTQPLIISFNAMKSIWQLNFFLFYQWSMYWAYNITLYCTATYREYHIGTVKFVIHNHFHHFQYLHRLLKSSLRCPVTQRCSLDMSLILSCSIVCRVLIISRWWGWTNIQLLKCNIFVSV